MATRKTSRNGLKCEQMKTFTRMSFRELELDVNVWLKEQAGKVEILGRKVIRNEREWIVILWVLCSKK